MKTMGLINVRRRIIHTLCAAAIVVAAGCATTPRKPALISFDLALPSGLPAEVRTMGLDALQNQYQRVVAGLRQ